MSATITLTGPTAKLMKVLEFWDGINKAVPAQGLGEFVRGFTKDSLKAVGAITKASSNGERLYQNELFELLGLHGENEVWGVMGWVGKLWTKTMRSSNPFTRKWDEARSEGFYQIDESLATELTHAIEEAADRQELVVYIQGGQSIKVPPRPQTSGDTN